MSRPSSVLVARLENGILVRVKGHGTVNESAAFREFVSQSFKRMADSVVVDMSDCDYLDSTFLGCLIGLQKECEHDPRRFVIAASEADRVRLFATSTLDKYLHFTDSCPHPASEFLELETPPLAVREMGAHVMQSHRQLASLECKDRERFKSIADRLSEELDM